MASVKVNTTMQEEMVSRIDNYCATKGMTRSAFLSMAATQYLDAIEKQPIVGDAFAKMGELFKLAVSGKTESKEYAVALSELESANAALKK